MPRRGHDHEDRLPRLDEGDGAVLELAGREALGVDVGDLLELESPFERDRIAHVATEEKHRLGVAHPPRELLDVLLLALEDPRDLLGHGLEFEDLLADLGVAEGSAHVRDVQCKQVERRDLRDERLGRSDSDLGPRVRVDDRIRLARDRRPLRVADRQGLGAALARVLDCHEGVHRLAGLADRDDESVSPDHGVAVAELMSQLDIGGHPRPLLDRVLADHARVGRGAAGHHDHAIDSGEQVVEAVEFGDRHDAVTDASPHRVRDSLGLLRHLLGHER